MKKRNRVFLASLCLVLSLLSGCRSEPEANVSIVEIKCHTGVTIFQGLSPDGKRMVTGIPGSGVFDVESGAKLLTLKEPLAYFSPDGRNIATGNAAWDNAPIPKTG